MQNLCDLTLPDLQKWMQERQEKAFHAKQIFLWLYARGVCDFDAMSDLRKELREKLKQNFSFPLLQLFERKDSKEGETVKFLWRLTDGHFVESVLIYAEGRRSVCLSSQVGCPVQCAFCASGKRGFIRNLTTAEIVEQLLFIDRFLREKKERVTHAVFMGMGEPLENYDAVVKAIAIFNHPDGLAISQRKITLSTVGLIEGIDRLGKEELKINLALSLHAPSDALRKKLIPYARKYPLDKLLEAMDRYFAQTSRDITYEYTLFSKVNDSKENAQELAYLLRKRQCSVNLIPYNPVEGFPFHRPEKESVENFRSILIREGIRATWRYTKGKDIAAACGQLAGIAVEAEG